MYDSDQGKITDAPAWVGQKVESTIKQQQLEADDAANKLTHGLARSKQDRRELKRRKACREHAVAVLRGLRF